MVFAGPAPRLLTSCANRMTSEYALGPSAIRTGRFVSGVDLVDLAQSGKSPPHQLRQCFEAEWGLRRRGRIS